ncbi:MAG: hypothetical protein WCK86_17065 [Planctomycetia bacterium]
MADTGIPGLHWDAAYYSSAILNVSSGKGWVVDVCGNESILENPKYSGHGVLDVWLHGKILGATGWESLGRQFAVINSLCFAVWAVIFSLSKPRTLPSQIRSFMFAYVLSFICLGLQGRPEHLSSFILTFPAALWQVGHRNRGFLCIWSVTSGVLFSLSPLLGVMSGLCTLVLVDALAAGRGMGYRVGLLLGSGICSLLVASLVIELIHPDGFITWLASARNRGETAINFLALLLDTGRHCFFGVSLVAPFWNLVGLLTVGMGFWKLLRSRNYVFLAGYCLLTAAFVRTAADYSIVSMYPVLFVLIATMPLDNKISRTVGNLFGFFILANLVGAVVGLHQTWHASGGDASKAAVERSIGELCAGKGLHTVMQNARPSWCDMRLPQGRLVGVLPDRKKCPENSELFRKLELLEGQEISTFIYPQSYRGTPPEKMFLGEFEFRLSFNNWSVERYSMLGLPLPGRKPGYRFALYRRVIAE